MGETKMNRQLGTKWFTFYAKVRPWLACLMSLTIIVDFFQYMDVYLSYWWMLLYFITGVAQPVLAIVVFAKSEGDYGDFVRFVNGVLIFETINMAYQQGVQQYIKSFEFGTAFIIALIILVVGYFLWYRLNIKYFKKRILRETPEPATYDFNAVSRPPQFSCPNEVPKTYGNYNIYGNDIKLQKEENTTTDTTPVQQKAQFCRKCGTKLAEDALFCTKCGTKVITDEAQGE